MGTWGAENFADDTALDWLRSAVERPLIATIEANLRKQDEGNDHIITAAAEVLAVVCEQLRAVPPEPQQIVGWRDSYLRAWDGYIDELCPDGGDYPRERREVIVATFHRLLALAKKWHAIPLRVDFEEAMSEQTREQLRQHLHAALVATDAGEVSAGETFENPDANGTLTVITGRAFTRDAARDVLRWTIQALDIRSATWICFGEPIDEYAEAWFVPYPPQ